MTDIDHERGTHHRGAVHPPSRYLRPNWFARAILNPTVSALTRIGISVWGSRILDVRGRSSGEWRSVPVNVLEIDGHRYLVAPRGHTQWVRNLRAARSGRLRVGRRSGLFSAVEVPVDERATVLREYLTRWRWEVGTFFDGVRPDSTDEELSAVAHDHPVFALDAPDSTDDIA
jgi:deazaflavin-dependent oxidoreductase (nitroreductase family)